MCQGSVVFRTDLAVAAVRVVTLGPRSPPLWKGAPQQSVRHPRAGVCALAATPAGDECSCRQHEHRCMGPAPFEGNNLHTRHTV